MATDLNEIPMQIVYVLVAGFLIVFVGSLITFWAVVIGALVIAAGAFMGYMAQGAGGSGGGLGDLALNRELAKTHCGQCGASMRSNMQFCPVCGAKQAPV